jgi:hypothetical protein
MVAETAGIKGFRYPTYPGPEECPGLPLNLEAVARFVEGIAPGTLLDLPGDVHVAIRVRSLMDTVEDYWERGDGRAWMEAAADGPVNHNLAIWGWDVRDALSRSAGHVREQLAAAGHRRDDIVKQIPSGAGERSALLTLSGAADADTPLSLARKLGDDGDPGIETLVVALGANNVLGTVLNFRIRWTSAGDGAAFADVDAKRAFNAWTPSHFAVEYDALLDQVRQIKARHVIFLTVPHVTIAPMVRGIDGKMPGDRYFARYTRAWIPDAVFSANRHPCLTGDQLRVLDYAVDCYNDHIVSRVEEARRQQRDWRVLDVAGILDRLAYRRYLIDEDARPSWWHEPYRLPDAYLALSPPPDTRFYLSDRFGRSQGGLIALDGVHPTTAGYALLAREVMRVMAACGVSLNQPEPDFDRIVGEEDTLIARPPAQIHGLIGLVELANRGADLWQALCGADPV